jgi:hypothetical protein
MRLSWLSSVSHCCVRKMPIIMYASTPTAPALGRRICPVVRRGGVARDHFSSGFASQPARCGRGQNTNWILRRGGIRPRARRPSSSIAQVKRKMKWANRRRILFHHGPESVPQSGASQKAQAQSLLDSPITGGCPGQASFTPRSLAPGNRSAFTTGVATPRSRCLVQDRG